MAREGLGNLLSTQEEGFPRQTRGFSRSMRTSTPSCRSHLPKRLAVGDPNKLFHGQFEVKPLLQARRGLTGIQVFSTRREKQPALIFVFGFTSNITKSSKEKYVGWDGMGQQVLMGATLRELASRRLCTNYGTPHIPSKPKQQGNFQRDRWEKGGLTERYQNSRDAFTAGVVCVFSGLAFCVYH